MIVMVADGNGVRCLRCTGLRGEAIRSRNCCRPVFHFPWRDLENDTSGNLSTVNDAHRKFVPRATCACVLRGAYPIACYRGATKSIAVPAKRSAAPHCTRPRRRRNLQVRPAGFFQCGRSLRELTSSAIVHAFDAQHGRRQKQQNENAAANFKDQQ
jgi:hypothetical protein